MRYFKREIKTPISFYLTLLVFTFTLTYICMVEGNKQENKTNPLVGIALTILDIAKTIYFITLIV